MLEDLLDEILLYIRSTGSQNALPRDSRSCAD